MGVVPSFIWNKCKFCCFQNPNAHWRRNGGPVRDENAGAANRRKPNFCFAWCCEVSDQEMFRVVSGNRVELSRAHHHLSLIALRGTHRTDDESPDGMASS